MDIDWMFFRIRTKLHIQKYTSFSIILNIRQFTETYVVPSYFQIRFYYKLQNVQRHIKNVNQTFKRRMWRHYHATQTPLVPKNINVTAVLPTWRSHCTLWYKQLYYLPMPSLFSTKRGFSVKVSSYQSVLLRFWRQRQLFRPRAMAVFTSSCGTAAVQETMEILSKNVVI